MAKKVNAKKRAKATTTKSCECCERNAAVCNNWVGPSLQDRCGSSLRSRFCDIFCFWRSSLLETRLLQKPIWFENLRTELVLPSRAPLFKEFS